MWQNNLTQGQISWQKFHVGDCLKVFHFHFTLLVMIQISANSPILANTQNSFKNPPPTLVEEFLRSFFDLTQTWKTVPIENCKIWNSSSKLFCLYLQEAFDKSFEVIKTIRILRCDEDRKELLTKDLVQKTTSDNFFSKSKKM